MQCTFYNVTLYIIQWPHLVSKIYCYMWYSFHKWKGLVTSQFNKTWPPYWKVSHIGDSLFIIFASWAQAPQFLIELHIYHLWILKRTWHDYLSQGLWARYIAAGLKLKILQRLYKLTSAFANQKFAVFGSQYILSILHILTITKFHKVIKCLGSDCI